MIEWLPPGVIAHKHLLDVAAALVKISLSKLHREGSNGVAKSSCRGENYECMSAWTFNVHFSAPVAGSENFFTLDYAIHRFQSSRARLRPRTDADGVSWRSIIATKTRFFALLPITFIFPFSMLKHTWNSLDKRQKAKKSDFWVICAIGKCFPDDSGKIPYIAITDTDEITWLYHVISSTCHLNVIAMYGVWPGSSRKRLTIAQIALKPLLFAFCRLPT
jgi:hypothetical protein